MHWFNFGLLVLVALVLQVGLGRVVGLGPQRITPDFLLLGAVILAFRGREDHSPIACWVLGMAKDLSSHVPLGVYALSFGLMAITIIRLRRVLYRENPLTLIVVTLLCSFLVEQFAVVVCLIKGVLRGSDYGGVFLPMVFSALLTGALSPYGHWLVGKLERPLGLVRHV